MIPYVDFSYYTDSFRGTMVPEDAFYALARDASVFIREITHNRVPEDVPVEVKDAVCAVCEKVHSEEKKLLDGREIKEENTDGYSVTYVTEHQDGESQEESMRKKKYLAARPYLLYTGLLYLGVKP